MRSYGSSLDAPVRSKCPPDTVAVAYKTHPSALIGGEALRDSKAPLSDVQSYRKPSGCANGRKRRTAGNVMSEQEHLLTEQYRTPANLEARIAIHRFSTNTYGWMRWAFDQMDLPAEARVLEVGCGIGALWAENSARVLPGWRLTLTDMSRGMVAAAASKPGRRYQLARALAEALPFRPESFDAVVANHMLYHVPDRERAYREFQRVLAPGGTLYAATKGRAHMRELDEMMRSVAGGAALEPLSFTLESGGKELQRQFPTVEFEALRRLAGSSRRAGDSRLRALRSLGHGGRRSRREAASAGRARDSEQGRGPDREGGRYVCRAEVAHEGPRAGDVEGGPTAAPLWTGGWASGCRARHRCRCRGPGRCYSVVRCPSCCPRWRCY